MTLQFRDDNFADKLTGCEELTPRQRQAVDNLVDELEEADFAQNYHQNEQSQAIENSSYGYALWQELLARHRTEVQMLADYGVTKVRREAQHLRGMKPYDRHDPWNPACEMLIVASDPSYVHPLTSAYPLITAISDSRCCDIAITSKCNERADDQLFVKHGQMLGFWHACSDCVAWLLEMARVEHEPATEDDIDRRVEHFLEVWHCFGYPSRDLTGFMRLPLTVPDRCGRLQSRERPNLRVV
ncbi:hypothetical protein [Mycobacterium sp. 1274761.0]|uniref:hypothetical protein n=1 Tax=Mycobacterium sp. 1274761.0 TaxID=1834077 RepID=UPI0007FCC6DB|nr:hypothetical protein [Mycobacterium sp. 1274761.0]OBK75012.1 hypothetical protein A5651_09090 [Mycobacterium sp. 1274761.0]